MFSLTIEQFEIIDMRPIFTDYIFKMTIDHLNTFCLMYVPIGRSDTIEMYFEVMNRLGKLPLLLTGTFLSSKCLQFIPSLIFVYSSLNLSKFPRVFFFQNHCVMHFNSNVGNHSLVSANSELGTVVRQAFVKLLIALSCLSFS